MAVKVVTGYIDIPNHPRGAHDYRALGEQLLGSLGDIEALVFDHETYKPQDTWLGQYLRGVSNVSHSVSDNPGKNTIAYHCVQHQKIEWLRLAAYGCKEADPLVWIDYGIMHVHGVTAEVIQKFLERVDSYGKVTLPGCWPKKQDIDPAHPCWRFCGGVMVVPRALVKPFTSYAMGTAARYISETRNVEWEVNTLARLELLDQVPMAWYQADHNETMFTRAP
jgi:hypothetical protein